MLHRKINIGAKYLLVYAKQCQKTFPQIKKKCEIFQIQIYRIQITRNDPFKNLCSQLEPFMSKKENLKLKKWKKINRQNINIIYIYNIYMYIYVYICIYIYIYNINIALYIGPKTHLL